MLHYYITFLIVCFGIFFYDGHHAYHNEEYPITSKVIQCVYEYNMNDLSNNYTDSSKFEMYLFITELLTTFQFDFLNTLVNYKLKHVHNQSNRKLHYNIFILNKENLDIVYHITNSLKLLHMKSYYMIKNNQVHELLLQIQPDIDIIIDELKIPFDYTFQIIRDKITESKLYEFENTNDEFISYYHTFFHPSFDFTSKCQTYNFDSEQIVNILHYT
jgi:hypothetical protein